MGIPLHKPYPYSLYGWGFLHFRYLKCLVRVLFPTPKFFWWPLEATKNSRGETASWYMGLDIRASLNGAGVFS